MTALVVAAAALAGGGSATTSRNYNRTDATFAAEMAPHHAGGIELGRMAATKGVNKTIRHIGRDIVRDQSRELRILRSELRRFRARPINPRPIDRSNAIDMKRLQAASGDEFDRMWLDTISAHHSSAIQMAILERRGGRNGQARRLASKIIRVQEQQLGVFNALRLKLGG